MPPPTIQPTNIKRLSNVHGSFKYAIDNLFNITNGTAPDLISGYNDTTRLIQQFLADALSKNQPVRAMGGNWSWTKVAFTKGWIVNTLRLNKMKRILPQELQQPAIFEKDKYLFAQCGCSIQELNRILQGFGRSLKTSGASNGQTIAGAIANGTHGAAIDFGATPDFVVGLHIIISPSRHVYIERASHPVVSDLFIQKINADLIRDDAIFDAALVSFGSFGFVHGVMIETEPLYLLTTYRDQFAMNLVEPLMISDDFSNTPFLTRPNQRPFHFQVLVNPYDMQAGAHVTVMYKDPYVPVYKKPVNNPNEAGPGIDAPVLIGRFTNMLPQVTPLVVNNIIKSAYKKVDGDQGTHGEIFTNTDTQGRVLSAAVAIPMEYTKQVIDIALQVNQTDGPFVGVFSFRYVKQSTATLGFTQYPITCVAEFDSVEAPGTYQFYNALWKALRDNNIPHAFHWGKLGNFSAPAIQNAYGDKCTEWIKARNELLPSNMIKLFNNEALAEMGLDAILPSV